MPKYLLFLKKQHSLKLLSAANDKCTLWVYIFCCVLVNCVDRHVEKNPDRIALIWEKDEPGTQEYVTYR